MTINSVKLPKSFFLIIKKKKKCLLFTEVQNIREVSPVQNWSVREQMETNKKYSKNDLQKKK